MIQRAVRARLNSTVFLARTAVALSALALLVALSGVTPASAVSIVKRALSAKNADAVDGISASRTPRARRLVPLGRNRKFPRAVIPASGLRGPRGPIGLPGPAGRAGTSSVHVAGGGRVTAPATANAEVEAARLDNLPAGNWLLLWSATIDNAGAMTDVWCKLRVGAEDFAGADATVSGSNLAAVMTSSTVTTQAGPFSVVLRCFQTGGTAVGIDSQRLVAIRADELAGAP